MDLFEQIYHKAARDLVPLSVHFDLTYLCHQRCVHCYIPEAWRRGEGSGPELTTAQVKATLGQLAAAGTFFLTFSGGEVLLRPDLFDLLEHARRLNFAISLFTSGTLGLDKERIRFLGELGLEAILVSLYSLDPRVHDEITGNPGSWRKVRQVMDGCVSNNILTIVNSFLFKVNFKEVEALRALAIKNKLEIRFNHALTPRWDGTPHPEGLTVDKNTITSYYRENEYCLEGTDHKKTTDSSQTINCRPTMNLCYLSPLGEVRPCIDIHRSCGRLTARINFQQLWSKSRELNRIRNFFALNPNPEKPLCSMLKN